MPMKRTFTKWWAILMLLTTVFLVPLTASAKKIYLDPGPWDTAGAWFSAWGWGDGQDGAWYKANPGSPYYEMEVADGVTTMHLLRFASGCTTENWDSGDAGYWNRMDNIAVGDNNLLTITGWGASDFSWSTFDPTGPIEYPALYMKGDDINNWSNSDDWKLTTEDGENYVLEFAEAKTLTGMFKVADTNWTGSKTFGGPNTGTDGDLVIEANKATALSVGNDTKNMKFAADLSAIKVEFVVSTKTLTITAPAPEPEPTPEITVSETEVDFGELTVGEQANEEVTYTYKDTEKPEISLVGNGFSYTDNELSIIITFAPVDAGEYEGTLTVGKAELAKTITLKGTAKEAEKPVDPVSNLVIPEFAETTVGSTTTVTATFDVNNVIGLAPQLLDNPSGYFTMGTPVYPDGGVGQASIEITFAPNTAGTFSANLYMPYAGGGLVQQVFSATAVAGGDEPGPGPEPAKPVDNIVIPAFAETTVGSTTTVTATFDVNKVEGLVPQLLDNASGFFSMGQPVMPDGGVGTATIEITFAPTEAGTFSANLYLAYAGGLQQQIFSATAVAAVEPEPENVTITFVNFEGWDAVKFHAWGGTAAGTEWPGIEMTKSEETLFDASIYTISFESGAYASCIFNNGAGTQTGNLTLNEGKPVYANGVWYASLDDVPNPETAAATLWLKGDVNTWNGGDEWQFATTDGENYVLEFAEATALTGEFKIGDATFATYNFGAAAGEEAIAAGKAYTLASGSMANLVFAENLTASKIEFVLSTATLTITAATTPEPEPIVITIGEAPEIGEVTVGQSATVFVDYTVNSEEQPEVNIDNDAFVASIAEANKVEIIFTPTEAKEYTATLTLAIGEVEATLELTATGVAAEEPVVPVSNIVIPAFAETTVGSTTTVTATFDVNNVDGLVPQLLGVDKDLFSLSPAVMPEGGLGQASIDITFTPKAEGTFNAILYLAYAGGVAEQAFSATAVAGGGDEPTPEPEMLTLYYVNNQGWEEVGAYAWNDEGEIAGWPGELATKTDLTAKGYDVYSYTFDASKAVNIIFNNNNNGSQTDNLTIDPSKPYFYIDQWYASLEEIEATSIEELAAYNIYATEGTIYADTEFAIYNLAGIDVTAQNGALQGNYIVKTEKGSLLISVW